MSDNKQGASDLDGMMEQIRRDLARSPSVSELEPSLDEVMDRVRAEIKRKKDGAETESVPMGPEAATAWRPAAPRLPSKRQYALSELLRYSDANFVDIAYRTVLRRSPDEGGYEHFVAMLRSGALSKVEILGKLRWSAEGRSREVHIDGLLAPYLLHTWRRKPLIGPVLSWLRGFAMLGTAANRQLALEAAQAHETHHVGLALNAVVSDFEQRLAKLSVRLSAIETSAAKDRASAQGLKENLQRTASALQETKQRLSRIAPVVEDIEDRRRSQQAASKRLAPLYAAFEDAFRGDRALVRARCEPYLEFVRAVGAGSQDAPVLDIGCGRGEWLELLRDQGLVGRGIDLNSVFIDACRQQGLDVVEGDAIDCMRSMPSESIGAITSMHLVEHLAFEDVIRLLDEARRVLRPGGLILLETPNPENSSVASLSFYLDPTHRNPIPPETLKWIVGARGFDGATVERLTAMREIEAPPLLADDVPGSTSVNVLLAALNAAPDYAVLAWRP
jgi:SAM-dependent methyltransferase